MKTLGGAAALGVACALLLAFPLAVAMAQTSAAPAIVTPSEQAARDVERVRILQTELAREQINAADAAQRRAERLAMRDPRGVQEAEQAQMRAADNIASLSREIDAATKPASHARPGAPAASSATPAAQRAVPARAANDGTGTPWWDVYAKAPRRTESAMAPRAVSAMGPAPAAVAARTP